MKSRPFQSTTKLQVEKEMRRFSPQFSQDCLPEGVFFSHDFINMTNELLVVDPTLRLGATGVSQIMSHPFFASFDWTALRSGKLEAPFQPGELIRNRYLNLKSVPFEGSTLQRKVIDMNGNSKAKSR